MSVIYFKNAIAGCETFDVPRWAKKIWIKLLEVSECRSTWKASASCKIQNTMSHNCTSIILARPRRILKQKKTFQSPDRPPEAIPSSTTSMQTNGCLRFGACFLTWALANLSISLASPRGSNLSVLWRVTTHGLLRSKISKAHWRAVLTNWSGETIASTRPKSQASCPLTGFDV